MSKKLLAIKNAIDENNTQKLAQFNDGDIESFDLIQGKTRLQINALLYATMVADLATIKQIIKMVKKNYFDIAKNYLEYTESELKNFNIPTNYLTYSKAELIKISTQLNQLYQKTTNEFLKPFLEATFNGNSEENPDIIDIDVITLAELRGNKEISTYLRSEFSALNIETITPLSNEERKTKFKQLMQQLGGLQSGWFSKKAPIQYRPPRSFSNERERQVLKQLSTLLHAYLERNNAIGLVEVEIMHLVYDSKSFLIVSANEKTVSATFPNSAAQLEDAFKYNSDKTTSEKNRRLTLYSSKIKKRVYDNIIPNTFAENNDTLRFLAIAALLRQKPVPESLILNYDEYLLSKDSKDNFHNILNGQGKFIFLSTSHINIKGFGKRRAEEFLVDIAEEANLYAKQNQKEIHTTIAGKMRPCITCTGRMQGRISLFGQHPGKAYLERYGEQEKWASLRSLACMQSNTTSWITVTPGKKGKNEKHASYDSASDTDDEGVRLKR